MLFRNTVVSCAVFAFSLILLWIFVQKLGMNKYRATTISFIVSNGSHYILGRVWIFRGSSRGVGSGLLYFFINALVGFVVTIALFALFTDGLGMNYLVARVIASLFAGLAIFALNALVNFKSL